MEDGTINDLKWKMPPPDTFLVDLQFNSLLFLPFYHTNPSLGLFYCIFTTLAASFTLVLCFVALIKFYQQLSLATTLA